MRLYVCVSHLIKVMLLGHFRRRSKLLRAESQTWLDTSVKSHRGYILFFYRKITELPQKHSKNTHYCMLVII